MVYINNNNDVFTISGSDSQDLLQRISTNDISLLNGSNHINTLLLNDKGKIESKMKMFNLDDSFLCISNSFLKTSVEEVRDIIF